MPQKMAPKYRGGNEVVLDRMVITFTTTDSFSDSAMEEALDYLARPSTKKALAKAISDRLDKFLVSSIAEVVVQ